MIEHRGDYLGWLRGYPPPSPERTAEGWLVVWGPWARAEWPAVRECSITDVHTTYPVPNEARDVLVREAGKVVARVSRLG